MMHVCIDEYTLDGEFLKRCEVEVKKEEVEMLEKNFKRAYWAWELPSAFRQQITVRTSVIEYISTTKIL